MVAFANSLTIAFLATIISLAIGALAAVLLWRYRFVGKTALEGAFTPADRGAGNLHGRLHAAVLHASHALAQRSHLAASVSARSSSPTYRSVSPSSRSWSGARLASFNKEQEEAARDLGANDWQAFRDVLLPHMRPALIAGGLARLHAVARRLRDHVLHLRAGHHHLSGQGLFDAALLGERLRSTPHRPC